MWGKEQMPETADDSDGETLEGSNGDGRKISGAGVWFCSRAPA